MYVLGGAQHILPTTYSLHSILYAIPYMVRVETGI